MISLLCTPMLKHETSLEAYLSLILGRPSDASGFSDLESPFGGALRHPNIRLRKMYALGQDNSLSKIYLGVLQACIVAVWLIFPANREKSSALLRASCGAYPNGNQRDRPFDVGEVGLPGIKLGVFGLGGPTSRFQLAASRKSAGLGQNLGWPIREGLIQSPCNQDAPGPFVDPVFDYDHS